MWLLGRSDVFWGGGRPGDWRLDPEERRVEGRRGIGVGSGDMSIVHLGDGWSNDFCILIFLYF